MKIFLTALCFCALASPSAAIVVKDSFASGTSYTAQQLSAQLGASSEFDAVGLLYNASGASCSGTLIASNAILTARHCVDNRNDNAWTAYFGTGSTGLSGFGVSSVSKYDPAPFPTDSYFNGTDLAVMTLSTAVTGIDPLEVLTETQYAETVALVGYGRSGTGSTGAAFGIDLERRYAGNTFERTELSTNGNRLLFADFDREDGSENTLGTLGNNSSAFGGPYEGLIGPGDSGGPLLFNRDGKWVVGGVATGIRSYDGLSNGDYGDLGVWTGLQNDDAISLVTNSGGTLFDSNGPIASAPVPMPILSLATGLGGLALLRRRRAYP